MRTTIETKRPVMWVPPTQPVSRFAPLEALANHRNRAAGFIASELRFNMHSGAGRASLEVATDARPVAPIRVAKLGVQVALFATIDSVMHHQQHRDEQREDPHRV